MRPPDDDLPSRHQNLQPDVEVLAVPVVPRGSFDDHVTAHDLGTEVFQAGGELPHARLESR
jgi:hypothetical protein